MSRLKLWRLAALGLLAGLAATLLWGLGALERLEGLSWDVRAKLLARPGPASGQVAVIVVDQASLDWVSAQFQLSWPWPRQVHEAVVAFCRRAGAKAVAFDILFTEPSNLAGDDEALAQALRQGPPTALAGVIGQRLGPDLTPPPWVVARWPAASGLSQWSATAAPEVMARRGLLPVAELGRAAALVGNVAHQPDADQIVRRAEMFRLWDGRLVPSLPLAALLAGGEAGALGLTPGRLSLGRRVVAIDDQARAVLNYRGGPGAHQRLSAARVIRAEMQLREGAPPDVDPKLLAGRYVLVGYSAPGLMDLRVSPLAAAHPGVEIQATALDNLLSGDFINPAPPWLWALLTLAMGPLAALAGGLGGRAWQTVLAGCLLTPLPAVVGLAGYAAGAWLPVAGPTLAALGGLAAAAVHNYATEGRQKRFIRAAFRHYLSPAVIDQLMADPSRLRLGGQRRELSIFFSDLQGFTSISEGLEPQELTTLLNDYLSAMTDIILDEGGTLDKYEGDAIIAFWNAPLDQPDHAARACRAALRCQAELARLRPEFRRRVGQDLFMRVGINSGPVVVGNMGSRERFDYTVLGDAANLASRLEGANKAFGAYLMVSEETWRRTEGAFAGRELGLIRVVGRAQPVRVFEPLAMAAGPVGPTMAAFAQALAALRQGDLPGAAERFAALAPDDPPAAAYARHCQQFLAAGQGWDGVWILGEK
ncbi:adenylate/guanylate cyclase with Chase sensor [Desulfarculus baarsii DSM 2075]|uniref:Adenylate/guanylate cyclase with Chase sensor n=1 Tax=Desulfarculus baarsii (strain ATCC 33931 / DSM 2075 / LMG 7858 / VKM B-1802 / 2st14) TaxID=644282 RepID=E1QM66_DESB2|nr:adenylate/guanylate cyclase domain-containing protein [Desulfarculus baarsii]ADK86651.1 adenylate/guanylate cyclase with Chase sensor [Desulfarculus baarsii DSM 2075]